MQIAITGGNGFIGQHLVKKHLELGDDVRVLSRQDTQSKKQINTVVGDLSQDGDYLQRFVRDVDVLYHCAGEIRDEAQMVVLHVEGIRRLVKAAEGSVGRFVQLSSVGAYGPCHDGVVTELTPESPNNTYEMTKTQGDNIVRQSAVPYVILRPSIVFSEIMTNQSLFQMLGIIRRGLFFYIGKPGALVNYVHVDDVVKALLLCATDSRAVGGTYNISQTTQIESMVEALKSGVGVSAGSPRLPLSLMRAIAALMGWFPGFPLTQDRIAALTNRCRYTADKIQGELDFEFSNTLEHRFQAFAESSVKATVD